MVIRPYQSEGIEFLVEHRRAALFDEPGLGKSMQALLSMEDLVGPNFLVIATGDAIGVWRDETRRWLGEEASVFAGVGAKAEALQHGGVVITNYHRLADALAARRWDGVIFDESQMLRNRNTRTLFKSVRHFFDKGRYGLSRAPVFFLSGTPIVKAAGDLWPILHLIDKQRWSSYWRFVKQYAITWEDQFGWHVEGVTNAKGLWAEVSSVALRRTVAEVQPYLPPKIRQRVPLTMTPKQAKAYRQLEKDMIMEIGDGRLLLAPTKLASVTRMRQLLVTPRLLGIDDDGAALTAIIESLSSSPRDLVIFTPFAQAMPFIRDLIERKVNMPVYSIRGGLAQGKFEEQLEFFRSRFEIEPGVLLSTVQMGKSWSVAEVTHEVAMLGFDWNNTTQHQAEARVHRDGQKDTVLARYYVHEGALDYDGLDVLSGKKRLADVILDRARQTKFLQ